MKKLLIILAIVFIAGIAWAGDYQYHYYNDGSTATSNRIGNTWYTNHDDGTTVTSTKIGNNWNHTVTQPARPIQRQRRHIGGWGASEQRDQGSIINNNLLNPIQKDWWKNND
jgi:hypothetical protein